MIPSLEDPSRRARTALPRSGQLAPIRALRRPLTHVPAFPSIPPTWTSTLTEIPTTVRSGVRLAPGETFIAESGAMAWMDSGLDVKARLLGGFLARPHSQADRRRVPLRRRVHRRPRRAASPFSPSRPGMVVQRTLSGGSITLTVRLVHVACTPGIELKTRFGGLRSLFSGEGLFFVECSGNGRALLQLIRRHRDREGRGRLVRCRHKPRRRLGSRPHLQHPWHGKHKEHPPFGRGPRRWSSPAGASSTSRPGPLAARPRGSPRSLARQVTCT